MAPRSRPRRRGAIKNRATQPTRRQAQADADTGLRTGSAAPRELSARPLEASIGFEVRRLRKSIDLTVADLGAAAGISAGMLSKIENGTRRLDVIELIRIADALGEDPAALVREIREILSAGC